MGKTAVIPITQPFNLALNLTMGQAFRWQESESFGISGWYSGVVYDFFFKLRQTEVGIEFLCNQPSNVAKSILKDYFRLNEDETLANYRLISNTDDYLASLVRKFYGTRLLKQDPWECLVAYICSANNSVKRISYIVDLLSRELGQPVSLYGDHRHVFPRPEEIVAAGEKKIESFTLGLKRAETISKVAHDICDGVLDLEELGSAPYKVAKTRLMEY